MANKQEPETVEDICEEMHGHAKDGNFVSGFEVARIANRIGAAHKRETERLRGEVARLRADYQCLMQRWEAVRREARRLRAALGQEEARA